jgi:CBS domain-containing membrane protein
MAMAQQINIDLDLTEAEGAKAHEQVARLALIRACGFTRDGNAPTITRDCTAYAQFEAEARRLKEQIDDAVDRARAHFEQKADEKRGKRKHSSEDASAKHKPRLDADFPVSDLMTREVRTVNENDRLSLVDELMKLGGHRHVVVLGDDDELVGVISRRDIFHGALAWSLGQGAAAHEKTLDTYPVKQVMESEVSTISPGARLREAAELMIERKIGCLPVVDGGELVGILTEGDFLSLVVG